MPARKNGALTCRPSPVFSRHAVLPSSRKHCGNSSNRPGRRSGLSSRAKWAVTWLCRSLHLVQLEQGTFSLRFFTFYFQSGMIFRLQCGWVKVRKSISRSDCIKRSRVVAPRTTLLSAFSFTAWRRIFEESIARMRNYTARRWRQLLQ